MLAVVGMQARHCNALRTKEFREPHELTWILFLRGCVHCNEGSFASRDTKEMTETRRVGQGAPLAIGNVKGFSELLLDPGSERAPLFRRVECPRHERLLDSPVNSLGRFRAPW